MILGDTRKSLIMTINKKQEQRKNTRNGVIALILWEANKRAPIMTINKKQEQRKNTRDKILDSAYLIACEQGLRYVTQISVCKLSGVYGSNVVHFYGSIENIRNAVVEKAMSLPNEENADLIAEAVFTLRPATLGLPLDQKIKILTDYICRKSLGF